MYPTHRDQRLLLSETLHNDGHPARAPHLPHKLSVQLSRLLKVLYCLV